MKNRLSELRNEHGKSQIDIASILGITRRTYFSYENGVIDIKAKYIVILSKLYSVSTDYLLGVSNSRKQIKEDI